MIDEGPVTLERVTELAAAMLRRSADSIGRVLGAAAKHSEDPACLANALKELQALEHGMLTEDHARIVMHELGGEFVGEKELREARLLDHTGATYTAPEIPIEINEPLLRSPHPFRPGKTIGECTILCCNSSSMYEPKGWVLIETSPTPGSYFLTGTEQDRIIQGREALGCKFTTLPYGSHASNPMSIANKIRIREGKSPLLQDIKLRTGEVVEGSNPVCRVVIGMTGVVDGHVSSHRALPAEQADPGVGHIGCWYPRST